MKNFMIFILCLVLSSFLSTKNVYGQETTIEEDFAAEYHAVVYNEDNGLTSLQVNALAQTPDGFIWAGCYSGLYRYDGSQFELTKIDSRLSSITALYTDCNGRLWIGTNDNGIARYETTSGSLTFFSTKEGLSSNTIRSICEDEHHNIYVGTANLLCKISPQGNITSFSQLSEINCAKSLAYSPDGILGGITNGGRAFFLRDDDLICMEDFILESGVYYSSICCRNDGSFALGTSEDTLFSCVLKNAKMNIQQIGTTDNTSNHNYIYADKFSNGYFICTENGFGFMNREGTFTDLSTEHFYGSVSHVLRDYQGNIWFCSNKQGILKLTRNCFSDIFVKAGLSSLIVNAVCAVNNELYIGTDNGVIILDMKTYGIKQYDFLKRFEGVRIRHILKDSKNQIWISTYGPDGLVCIDQSQNVTCYNEDTANTMGGRFRSTLELSDGSLIAASNIGLTFLNDGKVTATLGEENGLSIPQILSLIELEDGTIFAGSDGDGIYVIRDQKLVDHIGTEDGLNSLVILRIVKCKGGLLYITSNCIYYDNGETIKPLTQFPYNNNYDAYITQNGDAWISSSAGIYIVKEDELLANESYPYTLLNKNRGFDTTLTANAWNYIDEEGYYYLCCSTGVKKISLEHYNQFQTDYNMGISEFTVDNTKISSVNGVYTIPSTANRIAIRPAILNFTLSNPLVHIYLEGFDDTGITIYQNEMDIVSFTNLPYGNYNFHIQILNEISGQVMKETVIPIHKDAQFFEYPFFRFYLIVVLCFVVIFFTWLISKYGSLTVIKHQYEEIRLAKESADLANQAKSQFLANMSHEIRTPINTIMGMDELILRENISPTVQRYADDIQAASSSLLSIINDILDFSKIESGKMNIVEQEYNLKDLLSELSAMLRVKAHEKDLCVILQFDETMPSRLFGDAVRIKQIILNLLSNAVKYTEKGSVTFSVSAQILEQNQAHLTVRVADTGIGIHQEDMEKLFQTFERLDEKRNANIQGTGLGLNITKELLILMDSNLEVESTYGEGSCFYFTLKQQILDVSPIGAVSPHSPENSKNLYIPLFIAPDASILVIDDNEMNLAVIQGLLKATKVQITTASSGMECLDLIKKHSYDVILLDHMMPEMDGIETLEHIKTEEHLCKDVPVIILTANAIVGAKEMYLEKGFTDYLSKPVTGTAVEELLATYLPKEKILSSESFTAKNNAAVTEKTDSKDTIDDNSINSENPSQNEPELSDLFTLINVADGLIYSGGMQDFYLEMLGMFEAESHQKIPQIEQDFQNQNWKNYAILLHALKSTAKGIGADSLSESALGLEKAGKAEDSEYILQHHKETLELYQQVLNEITEAFKILKK